MEKRTLFIRGLLVGVLAAVPMLFMFQNCGQTPGKAKIVSGPVAMIVYNWREPCSVDEECPPPPPNDSTTTTLAAPPTTQPGATTTTRSGTTRCRKRCAEYDPGTSSCISWEYRCNQPIDRL